MPPTGREIREHFVRSLHADLVGPFDLDHPDATETLTPPLLRLPHRLPRVQARAPAGRRPHRRRRSRGPDHGCELRGHVDPLQHVDHATTLTKPDQILLRRTMRFLVNILEPGLADRARREGYSRQEHALGWQLWRTAAGETRPFEHWLREQQLVEGIDLDSEEQRRRLQEIDDFENTCFPRTRAIIRRVVSKDRRDAFARGARGGATPASARSVRRHPTVSHGGGRWACRAQR